MRLLIEGLLRPPRAVERIKVAPRWLAQFIILAAVSICVTLLLHPYVVRMTIYHLPSSVTLQDKLAVEQEMNQELGAQSAFLPVRLFTGWMSFAVVLFYACKAWKSFEPVRLIQLFSLVVVAESVMVLARIGSIFSLAAGGDPLFVRIPFGADQLISQSSDVLRQMMLNSLNLFSVWYIIILAIGVRILYGISKIKSVLTVVTVWTLAQLFDFGVMSLLRDSFHLEL